MFRNTVSSKNKTYSVFLQRKRKPKPQENICDEHIKTKLTHLPVKIKQWDNLWLEWKDAHEQDMKVCCLHFENFKKLVNFKTNCKHNFFSP